MTAARRLERVIVAATGRPLPLRVRGWDGSTAGPPGGPVVVVNDRRALRRMLWSPRLGLAQAYLLREIDVDGDLADVLRVIWRQGPPRASGGLRAIGPALRLGMLGPRPPVPRIHAEMDGDLHSRGRDKKAISFHYDQSTAFFRLILDERMTYSCAVFDDGLDLDGAQLAKLDLVCRKLGLKPGMRLLDVGCGWGALAIHAASVYGVSVVGVTLSAAQHEFATQRVRKWGLSDRVELRLQDYRDVADGPYDAVACLEMSEHVGAARYPAFARQLHDLLVPQGRLLLQHLSRRKNAPTGGAFITTYVSPDLDMRPVAETTALLTAAGFAVEDVQALLYARTLGWWRDNLEARWAEAVALIGEPAARIWRVYLTGVGLAYELDRLGVEQILAVAA